MRHKDKQFQIVGYYFFVNSLEVNTDDIKWMYEVCELGDKKESTIWFKKCYAYNLSDHRTGTTDRQYNSNFTFIKVSRR